MTSTNLSEVAFPMVGSLVFVFAVWIFDCVGMDICIRVYLLPKWAVCMCVCVCVSVSVCVCVCVCALSSSLCVLLPTGDVWQAASLTLVSIATVALRS